MSTSKVVGPPEKGAFAKWVKAQTKQKPKPKKKGSK